MGQLMRNFLHECRSACHERVVVRILVFAPMSVGAYMAANAHGGLLSA